MNNKSPLTGKELQDKIRSGEMKVVFAEHDQIDWLRPYIDKVLEAIGHPKALVSDKSSIGDFRTINFLKDDKNKKDTYQEFINDISVKLDIDVNKKDYLIDIAMRLKALESDA